MRNPPEDEPNGAVPTESLVAKPRASPTCVAPTGRTNCTSVFPSVSSGIVVVVPGSGGAGCAEAAMVEPIRRIAAQAAEAEDILIEQDSDNLTLSGCWRRERTLGQ